MAESNPGLVPRLEEMLTGFACRSDAELWLLARIGFTGGSLDPEFFIELHNNNIMY